MAQDAYRSPEVSRTQPHNWHFFDHILSKGGLGRGPISLEARATVPKTLPLGKAVS